MKRGVFLLLLPLLLACTSAESIRFEANSEGIRAGVAEAQAFVRDGWHLPLRVRVYLSNAEDGHPLEPPRQAEEEALVLEQLEQVRRCYANTPFDFFGVDVTVVREGAAQLDLIPDALRLEIRLPAAGSAYSADDLLVALAKDYDWKRDERWYAGEQTEHLLAALRRDAGKLQKLEETLRHDCHRLELLAGTLARRARTSDQVMLTPSEADFARGAQFRSTYAINRVLNTLARWRLASQDPQLSVQPQALTLAYYARLVHQVYLDWMLKIVVGGRTKLKFWREDWRSRNVLYTVLDASAPMISIAGRELPGRVPNGGVRALLALRLDGSLRSCFERLDADWESRAPPPANTPLASELQEVTDRMQALRALHEEKQLDGFTAWKELWDARIKDATGAPFYGLVAAIARFLGDTRTSHPDPAVDAGLLAELEAKLRPGDVILVRQDLYLSNAFLPGFWPHAILHLGPESEWTKLKLPDGTPLGEDTIVRAVLERFREPIDDRPARVIEAISEGVVFNSLEHAVQKDYVAILRPQLPEAAIAAGIRRALRFLGRPYDFSFDFATDDRLVCTELVYRAYEPDLHFAASQNAAEDSPMPGVIDVMGRQTMPANEVAKLVLYMDEHPEPRPKTGYLGQRLRLVSLFDRLRKEGRAEHLEGSAALQRFRESVER